MGTPGTYTKIPLSALSNPVVLVAVGFGSGLSPKAPGTAGTLVAIPLYLLMQPLPLIHYALLCLVMMLVGVWICAYSARKLGVHDHPGIVFDEIAGFILTMFAVPYGWGWLLAGFVLFRLFDVLKPWPISWLDRHVGGGAGIMLDDIAAGMAALALLQLYRILVGA